MKFKFKNKGFSLIEISIALVIIGLIASAALKGRELVERAKLRALIDEVSNFKVAVSLFVDKYGALPGEFSSAHEIMGEEAEDGHENIVSLADAKRFWIHLANENLLNVQTNNGFPTSKIGGIYTVSSNVRNHPGYWLILCASTSDNAYYNGILTPEEAYYIDRNNDTGCPFSGDIQCVQANNAVGECFVDNKYNLKNKNKDCVIMFRIW